jgi:hypothetical protein
LVGNPYHRSRGRTGAVGGGLAPPADAPPTFTAFDEQGRADFFHVGVVLPPDPHERDDVLADFGVTLYDGQSRADAAPSTDVQFTGSEEVILADSAEPDVKFTTGDVIERPDTSSLQILFPPELQERGDTTEGMTVRMEAIEEVLHGDTMMALRVEGVVDEWQRSDDGAMLVTTILENGGEFDWDAPDNLLDGVVRVFARGDGGTSGGTTLSTGGGGGGGGGGYAEGDLPVTPGETYSGNIGTGFTATANSFLDGDSGSFIRANKGGNGGNGTITSGGSGGSGGTGETSGASNVVTFAGGNGGNGSASVSGGGGGGGGAAGSQENGGNGGNGTAASGGAAGQGGNEGGGDGSAGALLGSTNPGAIPGGGRGASGGASVGAQGTMVLVYRVKLDVSA